MKQLKTAWLDIWSSVEILMVIVIPVLFIIKGLIDVNLTGTYDIVNYLKLFAQILVESIIFFGLLKLIEQLISWWRNRA